MRSCLRPAAQLTRWRGGHGVGAHGSHSGGAVRVPPAVRVLDGEVGGTVHDSVVIDQRHGTLAMMRHLFERCDAQRIIFRGGPRPTSILSRGWGISGSPPGPPAKLSCPGDVYHLDYDYETAFRLGTEHVRAWAGPGHCVFAANDEMAAGIVAAATAAGPGRPRRFGRWSALTIRAWRR